jgi:rubrerythrin
LSRSKLISSWGRQRDRRCEENPCTDKRRVVMKIKDTGEGIQLYDFNAVESYKIARKLENEGIRFYTKLLSVLKDPKVREVLIYLLDEEREHLALFEKMLLKESPEALDEREDEIIDLMDTGVFAFPGGEEVPSDLDQALQLGITIEKKSLAFYLELLKYTVNEEGKSTLTRIISEEKKHWEELKKLTE